MYTQSRKLLLASGIALAITVMSSAVAQDMMSPEISDARLSARISTTYALHPHLRSTNIEVAVQDSKATLTGTVGEDIEKVLAEQIALSVDGVEEVDNQIVVEDGYVAPEPSEGRSFGEVINDATITAAVKSKLMWSKHAEGLATNVDTQSGQVTLQGTASSEDAKALAERLAKSTRGVESVDNQLEVTGGEPGAVDSAIDTARDTAEDTGEYITDSWITTKVKSTFMWSSDVTAGDISITTTDGVVALTGKVHSEAERDEAIALAEALRGVKSVDAAGLTF
jgi:hyperosmotically inducible periplasmic protein